MSKRALVTGAARRIGRTIALELAAAGWDIVVHYNSSRNDAERLVREVQTLGRAAYLAEIDLANTKLAASLIPSLAAEIGSITALVNNASLFELDAQDPNGSRHDKINAEAPLILSEAFYAVLPEDKQGSIVNLLDAAPTAPGFSAYNRSKKKLEAATLDLARRFAPRARVNGVAPGPVLPGPRQSHAHHTAQVEATLLKTEIPPQAIASAVRFLIENPAITGEIIRVDGGLHLL